MNDKKSVLVVEDDEQIADLFREKIATVYDCEMVHYLKDAKERIAIRSFDCVVIDLVLPNGAGIDLIKDLDRHTPSCPIVVVSGYSVSERSVMDAGAQVLLIKPVYPQDVLAGIETAIGKWQDPDIRLQRVNRCMERLEMELGSAIARVRGKAIS